MRLICPNCDAQYEVSVDAIPAGGRDVQCSNCGHAWYQLPPEAEAEQEAEAELFEAPAEAMTPPAPEEVPEPSAPWAESDGEDQAEEAFAAPEPMARRSLDESVLAVLREEAERETAARRTEEPQTVETQPDLGLETAAAAAAATPTAKRIAQMKGIDLDEEAETVPARPAKGRDLLPDIEEINSTLRASSDRGAEEDGEYPPLQPLHPGRRGFRSGFLLMIVVALAFFFAYAMAPRITAQFPGSAGAMASYVETVDTARLWLDGMIQKASGALKGLSGTEG